MTNKKIIFIGTGFYDYDNCLIEALKEKRMEIDYINSNIIDLCIRILRRLSLYYIEKKYIESKINEIIEHTITNADVIFIIKGENLTTDHIKLLRKRNPNVKFVLYFWDSINRMPNADCLIKEINDVYTFDRIDSIERGLKFLPLFYRPVKTLCDSTPEYAISFVGSMHSTRYNILRNLKKRLKEQKIPFKFYLYTGKFELWYKTYITKEIDREDHDMFTTTMVSYSDYISLSKQSNVILDISNPLQNGLTIRSVESIGLNKKILTTNKDIQNYGFSRSNYRILDDNYNIDYSFLLDHSKCYWKKEKFTLEYFISTIFKSVDM